MFNSLSHLWLAKGYVVNCTFHYLRSSNANWGIYKVPGWVFIQVCFPDFPVINAILERWIWNYVDAEESNTSTVSAHESSMKKSPSPSSGDSLPIHWLTRASNKYLGASFLMQNISYWVILFKFNASHYWNVRPVVLACNDVKGKRNMGSFSSCKNTGFGFWDCLLPLDYCKALQPTVRTAACWVYTYRCSSCVGTDNWIIGTEDIRS